MRNDIQHTNNKTNNDINIDSISKSKNTNNMVKHNKMNNINTNKNNINDNKSHLIENNDSNIKSKNNNANNNNKTNPNPGPPRFVTIRSVMLMQQGCEEISRADTKKEYAGREAMDIRVGQPAVLARQNCTEARRAPKRDTK